MIRKHAIRTSLLALALLLSGCSGVASKGPPQPADPAVSPVVFVSGMGCSDPNCIDKSHHHDCPADCADYAHHHNCALDCTEVSHHHDGAHHEEPQQPAAASVSFVSGMGCSDPNCTDESHHHNCPADCTDYEHHHSCALDCAEPSHNHASHHEEPHHTTAKTAAAPAPEVSQAAPVPEQPVAVQTLSVVSYISGMGCSDPNCTDASHYHDCPADCADYAHYHSCALSCAEPGHCHEGTSYVEPRPVSAVSFVPGMGCSDPNCTDASHHHDCPSDCADYGHYHNCTLDCAEVSHHHDGAHHEEPQQPAAAPAVMPVSFVPSMGCSDPDCTDASHYHGCPSDCADYAHYHSCDIGCAEPGHCHGGTALSASSGQHHGGGHHNRHH